MLRLFGNPTADECGPGISPLPERVFVLLAQIRLAYGGNARRSVAAESLWEDKDNHRASANLRQLLAFVRKWERATGNLLINTTHTAIGRDSRHHSSDLDQFLSIDNIRDEAQLRKLVELYRGNLLQGISISGPNLEAWIREQQLALSDRFSRIAIAGAERVGGGAAEGALRAVVANRPYDEVACRALMTHFLGNRSCDEGMRVFESFHRRLFDDLHILPSSETTDLARRLQNRSLPASPRSGEAKEPQKLTVPRVLILQPPHVSRSPSGSLIHAMVEDVTLNLCRTREFAVIAPYSAAQMKFSKRRPDLDLQHADYVVTTSARTDSGGPVLEVRLVRTESAEVLWFEPVSLKSGRNGDPLHHAANWLATIIATTVQRAELRELQTNPGVGAYRHYLMGRRHLREISLQGVRRARKWLRSASELDDQFAPAYSWLAQSYILEWMIFSHGSIDLLLQAEAVARRAIEVDPLDGNGHRALGRASLFLGRLDESLGSFVSAERFAPHHADMLADYADTLMHNSRPKEAKERIVQALELNPIPPDVYRWIAGGIGFFNGEPQQALAHLRQMSKPDQALRLMAACAVMAGEPEEAHCYRTRALEVDPDFRIDTWTSRLPQRKRSHLNLYTDALRAAGFV